MKRTIVMQAPIYSLSGYGAHSRDILLSLWDTQKYNLLCFPVGWGGTSLSYNLPPNQLDILNFIISNKINKNVEFIWVHVGIPTEFQRKGKFNVGITAGIEATSLPNGWAEACNKMDAIIVPSFFVQQLFINNGVTTPVYVVGEGIDTKVFDGTKPHTKNRLSELLDSIETESNFLGGGQWLYGNPGEDRKGIGALINTFMSAFEHDKRIGLILKTFTTNNSSVDRFLTRQRVEEFKAGRQYPKIHVISGDLSYEELHTLYTHEKVKGFVSMTCGEGFGRMGLEAAACNLPTLMTGWSGHMDYCSKDVNTLIDFSLEKIPTQVIRESGGMFTPNMNRARVDVNDAKKKMRKMVENYPIAKQKAIENGVRIRNEWNKEVCYSKMVELFDKFFNESNLNSPNVILPISNTIK